MIQISSKDTLYMYNLYHIVKAFFPNEEISQNLDEKQESLVSVKLEENSCFMFLFQKLQTVRTARMERRR